MACSQGQCMHSARTKDHFHEQNIYLIKQNHFFFLVIDLVLAIFSGSVSTSSTFFFFFGFFTISSFSSFSSIFFLFFSFSSGFFSLTTLSFPSSFFLASLFLDTVDFLYFLFFSFSCAAQLCLNSLPEEALAIFGRRASYPRA